MKEYKDVFISYSHQDKDIIDKITDDFSKNGVSYWRDIKELKTGDYWNEEIVTAIHTVKKFVILLTINSIRSQNVSQELYLAYTRDPEIVQPIYYDDVFDPPSSMKQMLLRLQWFNIYDDYSNLRVLTSELKEKLDKITIRNKIVSLYLSDAAFETLKLGLFLKKLTIILETDPKKIKLHEPAPSSSPDNYLSYFMDSALEARLKTLALNGDSRIIDLGIEKVKSQNTDEFIRVNAPANSKGSPFSVVQIPQSYVEENHVEEKDIFPVIADTMLRSDNFGSLKWRELETGWGGLGFGGLSKLNSVKILSLNDLILQEIYRLAEENNLRFKEAKKRFSSENADAVVKKARSELKIKPKETKKYLEYFLSQA